jgi:hypothetical protein
MTPAKRHDGASISEGVTRDGSRHHRAIISLERTRIANMAAFTFNPALRLAGRPDVLIHSIDEAADFVRSYQGARRPISQAGILRKLEAADGLEQEQDAANDFRAWAESEGLVIEPK